MDKDFNRYAKRHAKRHAKRIAMRHAIVLSCLVFNCLVCSTAAKRAGCPVLLISSLRNIGKDEKEPNLTWFRGSGYLGYDAGAAIVLKGAGWANQDDMDVEAYIIKNRTRRVPDGPLQMVSRPKHGLFE